MDKHVDLLGILMIIWGALSVLAGTALLLLSLGAAALMGAPTSSEGSGGLAAGMLALMFAVMGGGGVCWGLMNVGTGAALRKHRALARLAALVLLTFNLFFVPFGTTLGGYGLWVLLNRQGRALFESRGG